MTEYKKEFIEFMVRSNVLTFGEFTLKSGRVAPYFINTGNYNTGEQLAKLGVFYANCIKENLGEEFDVLYGPAYKGIPLAVTTASSLYSEFKLSKNYSFNRKESKDHGEGGLIVGYQLQDDDRIVIVEDVMTSGAALRENLPILNGAAKVKIVAFVMSVDRMEKGLSEKSAVQEAYDEYGIKVYPIVNIYEIIEALHNNPVDGKVYIDDEMKKTMESYLKKYGVLCD